jgi:hypothetical protein
MRILPALFGIMLLVTGFALPVVSQCASDSQKIGPIHLQNVTLLDALRVLSAKTRLPVGFEKSAHTKDDADLTFEDDDCKVGRLLTWLVVRRPEYTWAVIDGNLRVFPRVPKDNTLSELLEVRIRHFSLTRITSIPQLRAYVTSQSEVAAFITKHNLLVDNSGVVLTPNVHGSSVNIELSNEPLARVLNEIALRSDYHLWTLGRSGDDDGVLFLTFS